MHTTTNDTRFLELLHKWRTGDFTRSDEQEMRRLAAGDPFRQEAMEGLIEHPELDHASTVAALSTRIRGKQPGRKVGFYQILAIAASLALVFGAIWFFNIRPIPADQGQFATELPAPEAPTKEAENPSTSEPTTTVPSESRSNQMPQPIAPSGASSAIADKILEKEAAPAKAELKDDDRLGEVLGDAAMEESGPPVAQAPGTVQEQSTNLSRPAERAKEEADYSKKRMASKPAPDLGQQKNAAKAKADDAMLQTNRPKEGWANFRVTLGNKARLTPAALANNVTGTVRIRFSLDKKNRPVDFKVVTGIGYGCDEAAIQLIKDADWIRVNNAPVEVDIPFVR